MVKMIFVVMVAVLVVIPMFVSCAPSTQTPPPVAVDSQPVKPTAPAVDDNKVVPPKPVDVTASQVKGFVYESVEGSTQIYYMKANSQDKIKLGQSGDGQPAWSPDGNTIAFISNKDGDVNKQIYTMDVDGKNIKKLTSIGEGARYPVWSPDGKKIAFISNLRAIPPDPPFLESPYGPNSLYVMNADGSGLLNISEGRDGWYFSPMWSPDGKKLVFICCTSDKHLVYWPNIFVINVDGTGRSDITNTKEDSEIAPCWSPDGQNIAFLSNRNISENEGGKKNADCWNLYVMKNDGTEVRRINADFPGWDGYGGLSRNYSDPSAGMVTPWASEAEYFGPFTTWSPDGKYITVCTIRAQGPAMPGSTGNYFTTISKPATQFAVGSLIVFDSVTGKEISAVKAGKRSVCWSPDSKRICYIPPAGSDASSGLASYRQITARNLVIMDVDGSNPQTTFDCNAGGYLNWHP